MPTPMWPNAHVDYLKYLRRLKYEFKDIAAALNTHYGTSHTKSSVVGKWHRLKVEAKKRKAA